MQSLLGLFWRQFQNTAFFVIPQSLLTDPCAAEGEERGKKCWQDRREANHRECGMSRACSLELVALEHPGCLQNQLELGKPSRAGREQLAEGRAWVKRSQKLSW